MQIKGDPERLGPEVPRRFPTVLGGQTLSADAKGSGRLAPRQLDRGRDEPADRARHGQSRLAVPLRQGLGAHPEQLRRAGPAPHAPGTARLARGARSSEDKWSVKALHRLIMLSRTYQQSSQRRRRRTRTSTWRTITCGASTAAGWTRSPIRDTLLAVAGNLDRTPGGAHPFPRAEGVELHAAQPVQGGLRHEQAQRVRDDAAHPAAPVPRTVRRPRHERQHAPPAPPARRRCRRST